MPASTDSEPHRRWPWRLAVVAILALGVGGFVALQVFKPRPAVRPPATPLPVVRTVPLEFRSGALTVVGHGLVRPRVEVVLTPEVAGKVSAVGPSLLPGASFGAGEVLVRLDPESFRAALAQAQAERRSAQASLTLAEQALRRTDELIAQGFQTPQTRDERLAGRDLARAALERAEAAVQGRSIDLGRTELRAPFGGRVLSKRVDVGESVQPGRELARLFADDALEVTVSLSDRELALLDDPWRGRPAGAGAPATVTVDHGGTRYRWPARLDRVEAAVDAATRTLGVIVRVDRPRARGTPEGGDGGSAAPPLLVGMYATVALDGRAFDRYAVLPRRALRDGARLWLVGADGRVKLAPVQVLQESGDRVAVAAPALPADARVIVSDLKVVTDGMAVRAVDEAGDPAPPPDGRR